MPQPTAPFGFTGELHDAGLVSLRARWYNSTSGVFLSRDPFGGFATRPYSLHPYVYAINNPVQYRDPTGRCYDQVGFLRDVEPGNCHNLDMAITIFNHPHASLAERTAAYVYISTWTASHSMLLVGAGILTWKGATAVSLWGAAALAHAPATVQTAAVATVVVADKVDDALMYVYAALGDEQAIADYQALQQLGTSDPSPVCDVLAAGIMINRTFPWGFRHYDNFSGFGKVLKEKLAEVGYHDVELFFTGSSVTGEKFTTGEPFDVGRVSDFDIAVVSPSLFQKAEEMGLPLRGKKTRTLPLSKKYKVYLENLGIDKLQEELSTQVNREVNFMIYSSREAFETRNQPSIAVP